MNESEYRPAGVWLLPFSGRFLVISQRGLITGFGCLAFLFLVITIASGSGSEPVPLSAIFASIRGQGEGIQDFILREIRFPRIIATLVAGAGMGIAGCLLQTIFRNPLATPDVLGLNEGAAFAIVIWVLTMAGNWPYWVAPLGGLTTVLILYGLCRMPGPLSQAFLISGIAVAEMIRSLTEFIMSTGALHEVRSIYHWLHGSFAGQGAEVSSQVALLLGLTLPALTMLKTRLSMFMLPQSLAKNLGFPLRYMQLSGIFLAVIAAALATSIGGPVVFISLAAPVIASRLTGGIASPLFSSAFLGAGFLTLCDTLGRTFSSPHEIAAGVISRMLGGAFLLWFLVQNFRRNKGEHTSR